MHTGVTSACFLLSLFTPGHAPQGLEPYQENQQEAGDLELAGWARGGQHCLPALGPWGGERPGLGSDPTVLKQFKGSRASQYLPLFLPKLELLFGLFDKNNCHYSILVFLCPQLFIPVNSFWPSPVKELARKDEKCRLLFSFSDRSSGNTINKKRLLNMYYVVDAEPLHERFSPNLSVPVGKPYPHLSGFGGWQGGLTRCLVPLSAWTPSRVLRVGCGA